MIVRFMAVILEVVYRLTTMGNDVTDQYELQSIALPEEAQVISAQVQDGLVTVTYGAESGQAIRIFDGETGEMVREIAVVGE